MSRMLDKMNLISVVQQLPKEDIETIQGYVEMIEEENQKLKKQVKDKTEDYKRMKDNFDSKVDIITKIDTQQKEFIKYLENMLDDENDIFSVVRVKDVLQKYKKIIGDDKQ